MTTALDTINQNAPLTAADVRAQVNLVQEVMNAVMRDGEHFGKVPGCGDKPTLLQPGAQKLIMTFRLVPDPDMQVIPMERGHREVRCKVKLYSQGGVFLGAGVGTCSTLEGKFRYRKAEQKCPSCGNETIIKGKPEYGGGWLCFQKKGGCGTKFKDGDPAIENQNMGRVEHDNPADYYNTVEKMAFKRGLVSATLTVTAASDIFTQDIEDMPEVITQPAQMVRAGNPEPKQDKGATVLDKMKKNGKGKATPSTGIDDVKWQEFLDYAGDDHDRMNVIAQLKEVLAIGMVADLHGAARVSFIQEFQKSCKETSVPCEEWVNG